MREQTHRNRKNRNGADPFDSIARAADAAADEVIEEDRLLRLYGTTPPAGRSR